MRRSQGIWGLLTGLLVLAPAGAVRGQEAPAEAPDLRAVVEKQQKQLDEQQRQLQELIERLQTSANAAEQQGQQPQEKLPKPQPERKGAQKEQPGPPVTEVAPLPEDQKKKEEKAPQQPAAPAAATSVEQYLKDNPGAGMPPGVQTGFEAGRGFFIRSPPNPPYVKWTDDMGRVPFELRIRGRVQADYYFTRSRTTSTI